MTLHDPSARIDAFLGRQPWYVQLPVAWRQELRSAVYCMRGDCGDALLEAGAPADGWYAILAGFVLLRTPGGGGTTFSYLALTAGEWFGEGSAMQEAPRPYEVVALRRCCELLCVPGVVFRRLLAASAPFSNAMLLHVHRRLAQSMSIIEMNRRGTPEQRVALYLSRSFWHGLRTLDLTQQELGALAGLSRQKVNTSLRALAHRGLVELQNGRVARVDFDGIERFVTRLAVARSDAPGTLTAGMRAAPPASPPAAA